MVEIQFEGKTVEAIDLDFEISKEDWAEYKLLDGGVIRIKTTVTQLFKIPGDPDRWVARSTTTVIHKEGV